MQLGFSLGLGMMQQRRAAALSLALLAGTSLSPLAQFSRASGGTSISSAGELVTVGPNVPRWQHDTAQTVNGPIGLTNYVRNPRGEGARVGVTGQSGWPTGWSYLGSGTGLSINVVGQGFEDGLPYTDLRFVGRITNSTNWAIGFASFGEIPAATGEVWITSLHSRVVSGTMGDLAGRMVLSTRYRGAGGSALAASEIPLSTAPTLAKGRDVTPNNGAVNGTVAIIPSIGINGGVVGSDVDFILRVGPPQLFKVASDPNAVILPPPGFIGAWTEQLVVNYVLNPRAEGVGENTYPLTWQYGGSGVGLSTAISYGTLPDGRTYADFRYYGTLTAGASVGPRFLFGANAPTTQAGDVFTGAVELALVAGEIPAGRAQQIRFDFAGSGSATALTNQLQRYSYSATATGAAPAQFRWFADIGAGISFDFTVRCVHPAVFKAGYDPGSTPLPPIGQQGRSGNLRQLGLLMEEQRTNQLLYSRDVHQGIDQRTNLITTPNAALAPDGSMAATYLEETTANGEHLSRQLTSVVSGTAYTLSAWVKPGTRTRFALATSSAGFSATQRVIFDLVAGTFAISSGTPTATMRLFPGGWWLVTLTATATVNTGACGTFYSCISDANAFSYTGEGKGLYLWGIQFEPGNFATSNIPTTGASATRAMDFAFAVGDSVESALSQFENTVVFEGTPDAIVSVARLFEVMPATGFSDGILSFFDSGNFRITNQITRANALIAQAFTPNNSISAGTRIKIAVSWSLRERRLAVSLNGAAAIVSSAFTGDVTRLQRVQIGNRTDGQRSFSGTVAGFTILSDYTQTADLPALSA